MIIEKYFKLFGLELFVWGHRTDEEAVGPEPKAKKESKKHPLLKSLENKDKKLIPSDFDPTTATSESMLPTDILEMEASEEVWSEDGAKEMPIAEFNEMFESNKLVIEKENFAYTTSFDAWVHSDVKFAIPKHCTSSFELAAEKKSYATAESMMYEGKVYAMDTKHPVGFSSPEEVKEYIKTLFVVYLVYHGISAIDRQTVRYFVIGCTEEQGTVPTHGL
jgi:hypothetical protein